MSKKGDLFVSYLGTDPTLYTAPSKITREVNYEAIDKEFAELTAKIKASQASDSGEAALLKGEHPKWILRAILTRTCVVFWTFVRLRGPLGHETLDLARGCMGQLNRSQ